MLSDGEDLEFMYSRQPRVRTPESFISCATDMGVGEMEAGYKRIRTSLLRRQLFASKQYSRVQRTIAVSPN